MAPNQAKIVITNPCSENWNSMEPDSVGRFCQSCRKSVIDFTSKSDSEIQEFLKDKQGDRLCGRFFVHQVERIRIEIDPELLVSGIPFWQKFLVVFLVCFGPDFLGVDFVFSQTEPDSIPVALEQVDSLVSIPSVEADTTLEASVDSIQKPILYKKHKPEFILYYPMPMISGSITFIPEPWLIDQEHTAPFPFIKHDPEADTLVAKTGIAHAENIPAVPKRRRRKPSTPENTVILAASDDRRKTRKG
jgi:hypothetical protein